MAAGTFPPGRWTGTPACCASWSSCAPCRRDVYAAPSLWRADPQAMVLDGVAWEAVRTEILTGLGLAVTAGRTCGTWTGYLDACRPCCPGPLVLVEDLSVSVAALLVAEACDVGLTPVVKPGVPADPGPAAVDGQRGELRQAYREGQEDQFGVLGLALNAAVLRNTGSPGSRCGPAGATEAGIC
jgi:hypothetical protein